MTDNSKLSSDSLLDAIPDPETVRGWLAHSIRQSAILRSLLRVAVRKANYPELWNHDGCATGAVPPQGARRCAS
jgi:hypothetical protein